MTPRKPNDFAQFCNLPIASLRVGNATMGDSSKSRVKFSDVRLTAGCADHPHPEGYCEQQRHADQRASADTVHFSNPVQFCCVGGVLSCVQLSVEIARKSTARFCRRASIKTNPLESQAQNLSGQSPGSTGSAFISTTSRAWRGPKKRNLTSRSLRASMRAQRDVGLQRTASRRPRYLASSSPRSCGDFINVELLRAVTSRPRASFVRVRREENPALLLRAIPCAG